jgi:hypothetical protein
MGAVSRKYRLKLKKMDWYVQAGEVLVLLHLVGCSKGVQEEDFDEKNVEACCRHQVFL